MAWGAFNKGDPRKNCSSTPTASAYRLFTPAKRCFSFLALPILQRPDQRPRCEPSTPHMSRSGIIGTWFGVFAFIAIVLGGLEHASKVSERSRYGARRRQGFVWLTMSSGSAR